MASIYELANLSALAYDANKIKFGSWLRIDKEGLNTGQGFYAELYKNSQAKEIVMTIRGTDFDSKDKSDFISDIQLALGRTPNQLEKARDAYERFKVSARREVGSGYAGYLTGHSLGGGLASLLSATMRGLSTVTFNAPGMQRSFIGGHLISMVGRYNLQFVDTSQMLHLRATGDVVSIGTGKHMGEVQEVYVNQWGDDKIVGASRHLAQHSITHMVESLKSQQLWSHLDMSKYANWKPRGFV